MPLQATSGAASYDAFGGGVAAVPQYIEDVFSTCLYTGTGSTQTINNGIDLAGKGGLVWAKIRQIGSHQLHDTARGINYSLYSDDTSAQDLRSDFSSLNANGFTLTAGANINVSGSTYASWTFREAPKFFDVVTYTGNGGVQNIAHNLGAAPGAMLIKRTSSALGWYCYHRSLGNSATIVLNSTGAQVTGSAIWNNTDPTSTQFTVGNSVNNTSGETYVAYLFAHNAGGFGLSGTDNVISCGSYTGTGATLDVNLGYEVQFVLIKPTSVAGNWTMMDNMRGMTQVGVDGTARLRPNTSEAESALGGSYGAFPNATGFTVKSNPGVDDYNASGQTYIYIAIRRGPMRTPTTGTSVFALSTWTGSGGAKDLGSQTNGFGTGYFAMLKSRTSGQDWGQFDQLRGSTPFLVSDLTASEFIDNGGNGGISVVNNRLQLNNLSFFGSGGDGAGQNYIGQIFRRAPGFFDEVCYTGTGANRTVAHNLGVAPELMIAKNRNSATNWRVYAAALGNAFGMNLNDDGGSAEFGPTIWNDTTPTASVFSVGTDSSVNGSGNGIVAYLFASCPGVSKVGSYTGTGTTQVINCGFTSGARFVLIKATSTNGNWLVWDTARGMVPANDPYLRLNSTAAEVTNTDWVDTAATGFELSNNAGNLANSSGVSYIFLAIA